MVLERTIENLKDRPHHERRAVAALCAGGVMFVLFIGWLFFFFRTLHVNVAEMHAESQAASAAVIENISANQ